MNKISKVRKGGGGLLQKYMWFSVREENGRVMEVTYGCVSGHDFLSNPLRLLSLTGGFCSVPRTPFCPGFKRSTDLMLEFTES